MKDEWCLLGDEATPHHHHIFRAFKEEEEKEEIEGDDGEKPDDFKGER